MKVALMLIKESSGEVIDSSKKVADLMEAEGKADRECFWVLHLNTKNALIEKELVSVGILDSSLVHPREVFKKAIINSARCIITIHNHPSDDPTPSKEDRSIWKKLDKAGVILGIEVVDHLIITPSTKYFSRTDELGGA